MTIPYPEQTAGHFVSFALAVTLTVLVLAYPQAVATGAGDLRSGVLALLMWGVAAGFIHGVGFVPRLSLWRIVFHPFIGWVLMAGGIVLLLSV